MHGTSKHLMQELRLGDTSMATALKCCMIASLACNYFHVVWLYSSQQI